MRSICVYQFGPPDVLTVEHTPEPQAGSGQLVIAVEAAGVLFAETQARAGKFANARLPFPFVPGMEVAGRVIGVGPGGDPFDDITRDVSFSCGIQSRRISA